MKSVDDALYQELDKGQSCCLLELKSNNNENRFVLRKLHINVTINGGWWWSGDSTSQSGDLSIWKCGYHGKQGNEDLSKIRVARCSLHRNKQIDNTSSRVKDNIFSKLHSCEREPRALGDIEDKIRKEARTGSAAIFSPTKDACLRSSCYRP